MPDPPDDPDPPDPPAPPDNNVPAEKWIEQTNHTLERQAVWNEQMQGWMSEVTATQQQLGAAVARLEQSGPTTDPRVAPLAETVDRLVDHLSNTKTKLSETRL